MCEGPHRPCLLPVLPVYPSAPQCTPVHPCSQYTPVHPSAPRTPQRTCPPQCHTRVPAGVFRPRACVCTPGGVTRGCSPAQGGCCSWVPGGDGDPGGLMTNTRVSLLARAAHGHSQPRGHGWGEVHPPPPRRHPPSPGTPATPPRHPRDLIPRDPKALRTPGTRHPNPTALRPHARDRDPTAPPPHARAVGHRRGRARLRSAGPLRGVARRGHRPPGGVVTGGVERGRCHVGAPGVREGAGGVPGGGAVTLPVPPSAPPVEWGRRL